MIFRCKSKRHWHTISFVEIERVRTQYDYYVGDDYEKIFWKHKRNILAREINFHWYISFFTSIWFIWWATIYFLGSIIFNYNVTYLRTCLLLYWSKIHRIFIHFLLFCHRVSFFLFYPIKIINVGYKKPQKRG